jgi:hypothetical protein
MLERLTRVLTGRMLQEIPEGEQIAMLSSRIGASAIQRAKTSTEERRLPQEMLQLGEEKKR